MYLHSLLLTIPQYLSALSLRFAPRHAPMNTYTHSHQNFSSLISPVISYLPPLLPLIRTVPTYSHGHILELTHTLTLTTVLHHSRALLRSPFPSLNPSFLSSLSNSCNHSTTARVVWNHGEQELQTSKRSSLQTSKNRAAAAKHFRKTKPSQPTINQPPYLRLNQQNSSLKSCTNKD